MDEERRKRRASWPVRKTTLKEQDDHDDLADTTPEERIGMMWQLTLDAWAFTGQCPEDLQMRKDVVRIIRPQTEREE